jgi:tRNA pseudouridine55 synthase
LFGLLNIDKPFDVTSRDVVNHVQRLVRPHKVGHAGTLDPLATGVLVVCVGQATRLIEFVQCMAKEYIGTFELGCRSDTEDTEGEVIALQDPPQPALAAVEAVVGQFTGRIMQRPPAFSALKVKGKRAYALARRGQHVELQPRPVTIHELQVLRYQYPELVLRVRCSSGTYIRSLGRDIGEALGTAAVMSQLQRTAVGDFRLEDACPLHELNKGAITTRLIPPVRAVSDLPQLQIQDDEVIELGHGRAIEARLPRDVRLAAAIDGRGSLIAIVEPAREGGFKPYRYFATRVN